MKKNYYIVLSLFIITFNVPTFTYIVPNNNYEKLPQSNVFQDCSKTITKMRLSLISVLDDLYANLYYWEQAQYRPLGYFIEKGPYKWFHGQKQNTEIQANLGIINQEILRNASYLATIQDLKLQLDNAKTYKNEALLEVISGTLNTILNLQNPDEYSKDQCAGISIQEIIDGNTRLVKSYKKRALFHLRKAKMPGHFQRHWMGYGATSLATLAGLGYYLHNKEYIYQTIQESHKAAKNFYTDYITKPIKNAFDIIYKRKEDTPPMTQENLASDEKVCIEALKDYYLDNVKKYKDSPEELEKLLAQVRKENNLPAEFWDNLITQLKNPVYNLASPYGQLFRQVLIYIFHNKIIADKIILNFLNLEKANKLNFELLVALPASALIGFSCYLSYKTISGIYNCLSPQKELFNKPIKQALLKMETILNANMHESLSNSSKGQLIYWSTKLKTSITNIPVDCRAKFQADVDELLSLTFHTTQKMNTIQRMFRTYEFLN